MAMVTASDENPLILSTIVQDHANQHCSAESALQNLERRKCELSAEVEAATLALKTLKTQINRGEKEVKGLSTRLNALQASSRRKQERVQARQEEIAQAVQLIAQLEQEEIGLLQDSFVAAMVGLNKCIRAQAADPGGISQSDGTAKIIQLYPMPS